MEPVSITDTTDWVCKCGHKHHEHLLINGDETCMHGMLDDIHDDVCCGEAHKFSRIKGISILFQNIIFHIFNFR